MEVHDMRRIRFVFGVDHFEFEITSRRISVGNALKSKSSKKRKLPS
jgi:hypothetical protein